MPIIVPPKCLMVVDEHGNPAGVIEPGAASFAAEDIFAALGVVPEMRAAIEAMHPADQRMLEERITKICSGMVDWGFQRAQRRVAARKRKGA